MTTPWKRAAVCTVLVVIAGGSAVADVSFERCTSASTSSCSAYQFFPFQTFPVLGFSDLQAPGAFLTGPDYVEVTGPTQFSVGDLEVGAFVGIAGQPTFGRVDVRGGAIATFGRLDLQTEPAVVRIDSSVANLGVVEAAGTLTVVGSSVTAQSIEVEAEGQLQVASGSLVTPSLTLVDSGSLRHSGGAIVVTNQLNAGSFSVSGSGDPEFSLVDAAGVATGISLGGGAQLGPSVFVPAPGSLVVEGGSDLTVNGGVIIGNVGIGPFFGEGELTVDDSTLDVNGAIVLAAVPGVEESRLRLRGGGDVTAEAIIVQTPTGVISVSSGTLLTETLAAPFGNSVSHTGGTIRVAGGTMLRSSFTLAGAGSPTLDVRDDTVAQTGAIQIGESFPLPEGPWIPEQGELRLSRGARMTTSGNVTLGAPLLASAGGIVDVRDAMWEIDGAVQFLAIGGPSSISDFMIGPGGDVSANVVELGSGLGILTLNGGTLRTPVLSQGNGRLDFNSGRLVANLVTGSLLQDGGVLDVGDSGDTLSITGGYVMRGGVEIEIGGVGEAGVDHQLLDISGTADLAGDLVLQLTDGFEPELGDQFELMRATGDIVGAFRLQAPVLSDPALGFAEFYNESSYHLVVTPLLQGDYNADGSVDVADYTVWRDSLDRTGVGLAADANLDLVVDEIDLAVWRVNFGNTLASLAVTAPEPATLALAALALVFPQRRRRATDQRAEAPARRIAVAGSGT